MQEKLDKEFDEQRIYDVHERFDYLKNDQKMANKIKDARYDITGQLPDSEDEAFTTDLEVDFDPADQEMYKQYKLL